ncbi:MAG: hypothetical protein OXU36_10510 [Candidatus Poribacteria bacterium]|nr:hypothetical protein [Candidatus Poribacteria bacterium]
MKYLLSLAVVALFALPAEAQLFGNHSEMQWLEGEVSLADPLDVIEGGPAGDGTIDGIEALDVSLTYVYAKAHTNVHLVGNVRYIHAFEDVHTKAHKSLGAGIRLYKWGGYAQGLVSHGTTRVGKDSPWDLVVSAGYYVTPRIGVRANWYAVSEFANHPSDHIEGNELGRVSAGLVWRF